MTNNFLRIASIVARQDFQAIANKRTTKKTRLMNVLQWNETIKAYYDKKLKKYMNIESSCYWIDMTYGEYKEKKGDFRSGLANKKPKFPKEFKFLDMKTPAKNQDYNDVNIRVCIDKKTYCEMSSSGIEACINRNVEFAVVFEEYAQINTRLADFLSKKLNIDPEICSSLLSDESFYSLCKFYNKNAKEYSNSNFSFSIENDGKYKQFTFKIDTASFVINIIDKVAEAELNKIKMIESRKERIADVKDMIEGITFAKAQLKEITSVCDKVIGKDFDIGFVLIDYFKYGANFRNAKNLQNAITNDRFEDYFVEYILDLRLRIHHKGVFAEYNDACNDYFELKEIAPEDYNYEDFNNAMEQYQKYKEEYDDIIIQTRHKIDNVRIYVSNFYKQDLCSKKNILEIVFNLNQGKWINRARKTVMNDFKDFKKFCEVYIDFVKKHFNEAIAIKAEQEISRAIN